MLPYTGNMRIPERLQPLLDDGLIVSVVRQTVDYTENRKTKNSRRARAIAKGTRYGREAAEAAWQTLKYRRCTAAPPPTAR